MVQTYYDLSFIVPTFNEENYLGATLDSIHNVLKDTLNYEVIVVDNGSTDNTREIAAASGAQILEQPLCAISALRNLGANRAQGNVLVFLDADVLLTPSWGQVILETIDQLSKTPQIITGSVCGLGTNPGWIEKCWWGPRLKRPSVKYINSGHMIMSRKAFGQLGGFNENLKTGEDPELCMRARAAGFRIINNPELKVHHEGYPKTVRAFFKRERWHGAGGVSSLKDLLTSKPILSGVVLLITFFISIAATFVTQQPLWLFVFLSFMAAVCSIAALHRIKQISLLVVPCSFLFGVYFTARMLSLFDIALNHPIVRKR